MAQPASPTMGSKLPLPATTGLGTSPAAVTSHPLSVGAGVGSGTSSFEAVKKEDSLLSPVPLTNASSAAPASGLTQSTAATLLSSSVSSDGARSPSKIVREDPPAPEGHSSLLTVQMRITRIFQRFLVRCPHTFIAIAGVFLPLYYGLGKESLAYSAATFVGVGGTVYCLTRAVFLEVIPNWMLPKTDDTRKWRHLMNATYTGFITVMFTSAVWKLPDLSATQGLLFLTLSFGAPYIWLAKLYPDIDKQPSYFQQKYDA